MMANRRIGRTPVPWLVLLFLGGGVAGTVEPTAGQAAKGWVFGQYRQVTPAMRTAPPVATRDVAPTLKLSRVSVQRPQIPPGGTAELIAEYVITTPEPTIEVKETRVIRYGGQHVKTFEKVVTLPSGEGGSSVPLTVPPDAAPGLYTVTTTMERRIGVPTRTLDAPAQDRASSVFHIEPATASAPPTGASAAPSAGEPAGDFKLWADKTPRKIGEALKVLFQSKQDGYVTLVNVGTSGKVTILFPNAYTPSHAVKAGQTYSGPGAAEPYELTLGGPEGVELVYALFTTAPTRFIEEAFVTGSAFAPLNDKAEAVTRDINLTLKKIPLKERATAVLEIEVTR